MIEQTVEFFLMALSRQYMISDIEKYQCTIKAYHDISTRYIPTSLINKIYLVLYQGTIILYIHGNSWRFSIVKLKFH